MSVSSSGEMKPLSSIQYLRAGAALAVVAYHALQWLDGGFDVGRAGVDVFFVISGLIMWTVTAGREVSPGAFLWRRFTRVAPLYWLASLGVAGMAVIWPAFLPQVHPGWRHLALSLAFIPHLDPKGLPFPTLPPGWTLNYEAIFYLVFGLSLAAPEKWRARLITGALTTVVAAGFLLDDPLYILGANSMLLQFVAGVWLGVALRRGVLPSRNWGIALIALAVAFWAVVEMGGLFVEFWRPLLWGIPATLLVAGAVTVEARGGLIRGRALTSLGDASYCIYLFHLPAMAIVAHGLGTGRPLLFLPVALLASIGVGLAARAFLEKPLLRLLRSRKAAPADALTAT